MTSDKHRILEHRPESLHSLVSTHVETALGKTLHQMEVRLEHVSVSAEIALATQSENELPTLVNEVVKGVGGLFRTKNRVTKHVLKDVSGVFKPGTMTLVLGQPGSGKSSLMKLLSGRFPMTNNITVQGNITYNGASMDEIHKRLPQFVSYVTQRDHHHPMLTVRETLQFAHDCCGGASFSTRLEPLLTQGTSEENKAAKELLNVMSLQYPDIVTHQLGLEICQNTVVGDAMTRGVSGGERKRVTTGEMQFGSTLVSFMDEISTGLDSAAAYDIIRTQRSIAKHLRKTVVIALLQPSPEVVALFDDVLLLNDGKVMYHGPRESLDEYFQGMGFVCPPQRDLADFVLDLGSHLQVQYQVPRVDGGQHPRKPSEYAAAFRQSSIYRDMMAYVTGPLDPVLHQDREELFQLVPEFHQSFVESTRTLIARGITKMVRNRVLYGARIGLMVFLGLLNGTTYWQFDPANPQVALGVLFASVLLFGLVQAGQLPTLMADRQIFYRQRASNFYRTSSYVLSVTLCQIPVSIVETLVFGSIMYWMCGFVASAGAFFVFLLLLFVTSVAYLGIFFFLSSVTPDLHVAEPLGMVCVLICVIFGGFIMPRDQIPDYLVWLYWINPVSWSLRALSNNQYQADEFDVCLYKGVDYCEKYGVTMGEYALQLFSIEIGHKWIWFSVLYHFAIGIGFILLTIWALEYRRFESPENTSFTEDSDARVETTSYNLISTPRADTTVIPVVKSQRRPVAPVTVAFRDLCYSVPDPKNPKEELTLLRGIDGYALPGKMTALMGSSGAGKTTLMDVIAGRKTGGKIRGQILLNGHEASDLAIRRCTGYCEQMDIHSDASTIREALTFSAFLRQASDIPDSEKYDSVDECLELLDLHSIADQIIRGSSVEQMKRLTIGVELAAQPSVLFLDEPTSGLDARSAKVIMDGVRKVADSGRTVVCTIHQPSTDVFLLFDSLLLLKRGGYTVYFGEIGANASELVGYLQSIAGVHPLPQGYNPSAWMLEVIGAGVGNTANQATDFVAVFNQSTASARMRAGLECEGIGRPAPGVDAIAFDSKRAASEWTQASFVIRRHFDLYWRTASYNLTRSGVSAAVAIIFGLMYLDIEYDTYQGVNSGIGMVFLTSLFIGGISFTSVMPLASQERASFYRERAAQTYNALWYFVAGTLTEIPYVFASSFLFVAILFPMVGFTGVERFFLYWLGVSIHVLAQVYFGQMLAYAFPTLEIALLGGVLILTVFIQFVGFTPPANAIPAGYKWIHEVDPYRFSFSVLASIVFGDCDGARANLTEMACQTVANLPPTLPTGLNVKEFVELVYKTKHEDIALNVVYIIATIAVFLVIAALSLRYINHQNK
ncbi:hypothetical protein Poli38472_007251 [Pythium oligandrum]|uniref:ABC transporter domain-containing protein n=1 Tax=Pythium oligandrum TaxID=41045 RepID=A0A8K1C9E1_PYTOL|nr:hypothetical protein Poli38472_007251 [Pythium oligandrum]|eukprot:TMW59106.1 hypothetical protein Poli38472_007251 [Pythium oligandrum]